jgi:flagellar protein FlbD
MIRLTRLNGSEFYLNPALFETLEETPDTHVLLTNGNRYVVLEPARVIIERMVTLEASIIRKAQSSETRKYLARRNAENYRPYCKLNSE